MSGVKDDPWQLTMAPGSSTYTMFRDESADPPALVCQVGSTKPPPRPAAHRAPSEEFQSEDWCGKVPC